MTIYNPDTDQLDYTAEQTPQTISTPASVNEIGEVTEGGRGSKTQLARDTNDTDTQIPGLNQLNTQHNQNLQHINNNYNTLINNLSNTNNPYTALQHTITPTPVHNPQATRARQAISSLYDALSIIGTAAGMGIQHTDTPPPPQLTSAATAANQYAHRMQQLQLAEDKAHRSRLDNLNQLAAQFDTNLRRDIATAQRQKQQALQQENQHYTTQRNKLITNNEKRKAGASRTGKNSSVNTDFYIGGVLYHVPPKYETSFQMELADLIDDANIDFSEYKANAKLPIAIKYRRILRNILNNRYNIPSDFIVEARRILEKYATEINDDSSYQDYQSDKGINFVTTKKRNNIYNRDLLFELFKQAHISGHNYANSFYSFAEKFNDKDFAHRFAIDYFNNFGAFGELDSASKIYDAIYDVDN